MRIMPAILAAILLAGCATRPPPHTVARSRAAPHPAAKTGPVAKAAEAATASKPADTVAATGGGVTPAAAAAPEPGSAIPFMGFRPMRGQKTPGA